jgi:hypothetical protein
MSVLMGGILLLKSTFGKGKLCQFKETPSFRDPYFYSGRS